MCVLMRVMFRIVIAAILEEKLVLMFGIPDEIRRMNSENASERLYSKFGSVETPAHMNARV